MTIEPSAIWQAILIIFSMGTTYGIIRADLKRLHEKISDKGVEIADVKETVKRAHERLDDHIMTSHIGK